MLDWNSFLEPALSNGLTAQPIFAAAGIEQLIIIAVIVGASLLHGWWKRKRGEAEEEPPPWPGQPPAQRPPGRPATPPARPASWEEELRRLLEGQEPVRRPPPPVIVQAPPPLPKPVAPRPIVVRAPTVAPAPVVEQSSVLAQSAQAYLRGSQLESRVAAHMRRAVEQVATHKSLILKKESSPEIREAISLLRSRRSQRAAMIASIVLGPPKALET